MTWADRELASALLRQRALAYEFAVLMARPWSVR